MNSKCNSSLKDKSVFHVLFYYETFPYLGTKKLITRNLSALLLKKNKKKGSKRYIFVSKHENI